MDLASIWLKKVGITVVDVNETSIGDQVADKSTI